MIKVRAKLLRICLNSINSKRASSCNGNILELRRSKLFEDIFPHEARSEAAEILKSGSQCVYAGFDPTADSLHVGNLLILVNLLHWQRAGHTPIALVGGATGLIGDPSGRTTERPELAEKKVEDNLVGIRKNIETIFKNHEEFLWKDKGPKNLKPVVVVNNLSWYKKLDLVHFISHFGRHLRLGQMLSRHSVQSRLESSQGISFTEFSYQLFQAYDWLHLLQNHDCRFQIGGSDQMGNIISGHDLIGKVGSKKVYGMTLPLVVSESGSKFGKSAGNAVWLNAKKTTPFELYQFFVRGPDSTVENLLRQLTFLSDEEIDAIMKIQAEAPDTRHAQKVLAEQVTILVHGETGLNSAQIATEVLFNGNLEALEQLTLEEAKALFAGASLCSLDKSKSRTVVQMALEAKCFKAEKDAINKISAGALHINMKRMTDPHALFNPNEHLLKNGTTLLKIGKKNYYIITWTP